jgi:hypothetical protein
MNKTLMKNILPLLLFAVWFVSCEEESNPVFDTENFTAIFDNDQFSATYNPIDFRQTADGGYLILGTRELSGSDFVGIYLMKADKFGNYVSEVDVDEQYVHPVESMTEINGKFYFFCMDELNVQAHIAEVSQDAEVLSITPVEGVTYPSAAAYAGDRFIVQGYNHGDKETIVALVNADGSVERSKNFSIGIGDTDDLHARILNHYIRTGRQFPFSVGASGGLFYFNGFYDFTFTMAYTDLNDDEPAGRVQGQQENGGLSAILPLGNSKFSASVYNFGDNYFLPNVVLPTSGVSSSTTLAESALTIPELVPDAKVRLIRAVVNEKNAVIFASTTISKQIGLFFYDEGTGAFLSSRYLGFSNPFEIGNLIQTADGGLAVCGTTYLAGRFPRICIFKISKEELAKNAKE